MKYNLYVFSLALLAGMMSLPLFSQEQAPAVNLPLDPDSKKILYREVVEQEGTPAYLYNKVIEWFGYYYLNPQSIYTVQDKENGRVEGLGRMKISFNDESSGMKGDGGIIVYQIKIELKENRYRYTLTDFSLKTASRSPIEKWMNKSDPAYNPRWDSYLYQVDTTMQRLISTLKEKMQPTVIKKDEW
jgi:hypothetical protein